MSNPYKDENVIDQWQLNYLPEEGSRYNGKLVVTDANVYFMAEYEIGVSAAGVSYVDGGIRILKDQIQSVEVKKAMWIFQRVHITLQDGSIHVIDRGIMSVQPIVDAIQQ